MVALALLSCGDMRSPSRPKGRRNVVSHCLPQPTEPNPDPDPDPDPDALQSEHSGCLPGHAVFVGDLPTPSACQEHPAHRLLPCFSCCPVSGSGYTTTQYLDLTVVVKIIVGSSGEASHLCEMLSLPETGAKVREILNKYMARKLQAMEKLLESQTELRGQVVVVKINNTPRHISTEVLAIRDQINTRFGFPGYELVMLIDEPDPPMHEQLARADVFIAKTLATKKFIMYYTVCRPEGPVAHLSASAPRKGSIIAKTRIYFRPTVPTWLTGAIRVNPWYVGGIAMASVLTMNVVSMDVKVKSHRWLSGEYLGTDSEWFKIMKRYLDDVLFEAELNKATTLETIRREKENHVEGDSHSESYVVRSA